MNKTNQQPKRQGGVTARSKKTPQRKAPVKREKPRTESTETRQTRRKERDSLVPLLVILVILLIITSFLAFSEKSSFLSGLFSKDAKNPPSIERPEIVKTEVPKTAPPEENSFSVTSEVEVPLEAEKEEASQTVAEKSMKSRLFFVKVSDEGQISLKSIIRTVNYQSAPLTETVKSLMLGPDRSELNKGLLNLIPQETELNSIRIESGTAYIDFNEYFRYNSLGIEGYKAQLMQIVYTATEFGSVDKVQFLIDGEKMDYLGAEGVYIGEPINRDYFNTF